MVAPPWDQTKAPMFRLYVWAADDKVQLITKNLNGLDAPITRITTAKKTQILMQPEQHTFTFAITDSRTGVFAPQTGQVVGVPGFNKGSYYELFVGKDLPLIHSDGSFPYADLGTRLPWASGYVQDIIRTATKGAQFEMTGTSSMIWLANFRNLNTLQMTYATDDPTKAEYKKSYLNVMYALNGLNGAGGQGGPEVEQGPGQYGMLSGTGWKAKYLDGKIKGEPSLKNMPGYGDSWYTAWETVLMNLQTIAQHYNLFFREGDIDGKRSRGHHGTLEFGPLNDSSNVTVWGGKELDTLLTQTAINSPITGGGFTDYAGNVRTTGNALDAAEYTNPLSVIQAVQFEDKMDHILNLVWPLGHGTSGDTVITIRAFFHPMQDKYKKINAVKQISGPLQYSWITNTLVNGVNQTNFDPTQIPVAQLGNIDPTKTGLHDYYWKWQLGPGERVYYLMKSIYIGNKEYNGIVAGWDTDPAKGPIVYYQLVASQNQDGTWAYGVLELNSAMKYGIHEYVLIEKKVTDECLLLAAAIGAAENSAEAVPSWIIPVKHPVDPVTGLPSPSGSSGPGKTPSFAKVGQTLDVRFTGYVYESIEQNVDGQWYGEGKSYDYLHFPTMNTYTDDKGVTFANGDINQTVNGLVIDKHMFDKISRIVQIEEQWTGQVYDVTYTMGKGKWRKHHWADTIAKRFEHQGSSPPRPYPARHLKHQTFDDIKFILEFGAWIDANDQVLYLRTSGNSSGTNTSAPGAIAVTDIEHDHFFNDSHKINFTVVSESTSAVLDFWFHKPLSHHLADIQVDANDAYGLFRLGFSNVGPGGNVIKDTTSSGKKSGFYVSKTDAKGTVVNELKQGLTLGNHNTNYGKLGVNTEYHITLQWHNGIHKAWVSNMSKRGNHQELVSVWYDRGGKNNGPLLQDYDYSTNPPTALKDSKSGQPKSQFGAIGWHAFGGDGKQNVKVYNVDIHPLRNSKGIHAVGEVKPDGSQTTLVGTHLPTGSGTALIETGNDPQSLNPDGTINRHTHIHLGGDTFTIGKMLTGTYPAKIGLSQAIVAGTNPTFIYFDYNIGVPPNTNDPLNKPFKFNGLPLLGMPHNIARGFEFILTSNQPDANGFLVSELVQIPQDQTLQLIKPTNFDPQDSWYIGFQIPSALENNYPIGSTISWLQEPHGGSVYSHYFKGDQKIIEVGTGKPLYEHGWGQVLETLGGKKFIIFADGRIGWGGEHQTDPVQYGGGLKSIANEVHEGEAFAAGLDSSGTQLFDSLEINSSTQEVFLYDENKNFLANIDTTNPNFHYYTGNLQISSVTVLKGGTGYTQGVTAQFSAPVTGTTATGTPVVDPTSGAITSVTITNPGSGYEDQPSIILGTPGTGADLQANTDGVPFGSPYKSTDPQSIQASWVYADQNDSTNGDSDSVLQLTTGGTVVGNGTSTPTPLSAVPTTVMWQDIQLLYDIDAQKNRKRKQFHVKKDVTFNFPIYIEPASLTGVKTLGAECTLVADVPIGSILLPIIEPVGDLFFATSAPYDTWSLNPSELEMENGGSKHEIVTFTGVDLPSNSIILQSPTTYAHFAMEPILQNTYLGQFVHSGGKMTSNQNMDDALPGVDAIAVGLLAEYQDTISASVTSGSQTVTFVDPVTDNTLNTTSPVALMINYSYKTPKPDFEVLQPGSYTLVSDSGGVSNVNVTSGGTGYSPATPVTFSAPLSGTTAVGTLITNGGSVSGISLSNPGSGYTAAPTITFGTPGTGAIASATLSTTNHITGFTATFAKAHTGPFTVTYGKWHRGWFGNTAWIAPYKNDNRANTIKDANGNVLYQVQVGSTRTMRHLGTIGGPKDMRAGQWIDLHAKTSKLGLFRTKGNTRKALIVGCEVAIHAPAALSPFTVLFDAHTVGSSARTAPAGPSQIKNEGVTFFHKNPSGFGDSHFHSDMYFWAQQDGSTDSTSLLYQSAVRNDGNFYVHWEHDTGNGPVLAPGTIITHGSPKTGHRYKIYGGARQDWTGGGVSEDHPNWGIPAWPLINVNGTISTATLKDGTNFNGAPIGKIAWNHLFFNSHPSGYYVQDAGVVGGQVWVPGHNRVGSFAIGAATNTLTVPTTEVKQWTNYLAMSSISSPGVTGGITYNGAWVLVTSGTSPSIIDPTVCQITSVSAAGVITLAAGPRGPVPSLTNGNLIMGQTMGIAVVTNYFEWGQRPTGGLVLKGPTQDFFKIGQIGYKVDPATNEIPINGVSTKKGSQTQRAASVTPKHHHPTSSTVHAHHNLAFELSSKGKSPNTVTQSTFHANKLHPINTQAQIELNKGHVIGALPYVNGKQVPVYINTVNPHDFIVYDTGQVTGYTPGYYAYTTLGTYASWYTGTNKPTQAIYAGQSVTTQPAPVNHGRCYTEVRIVDPAYTDGRYTVAWRFDPHKDDSLGFILIGRISEHPDLHTRQYYLEGHKPSSQKTSGRTTGKKSVGKSHTHPAHPHKKKRHKKKGIHQTGSKKKNSTVRHR